jgi:hypothetical protein
MTQHAQAGFGVDRDVHGFIGIVVNSHEARGLGVEDAFSWRLLRRAPHHLDRASQQRLAFLRIGIGQRQDGRWGGDCQQALQQGLEAPLGLRLK